MSKQIDFSKPLSDFDKQYLADRLIDWERAVEENTVTKPESTDTSDGTAQNRGNENPVLGETEGIDSTEADDEDVPYSDWDKDELELELTNRNAERAEGDKIVPDASGKNGAVLKADLVAALEADDATADDDTDESNA